ncbi:MAG: zinc-ribbon domain-containing protein [Dehalococcoidia bacterium]
MRCQTCGEELREGARFCPTCGTPSPSPTATTPPTVQIRRGAPESTPPPAESPAMQQTVAAAPSEISGSGDETIVAPPPEPARAARDPGAGYDPVGPPRTPPRSGDAAPRATPPPRATSTPPQISASAADFNTLLQRVIRLLRLDTSIFAELYSDNAATIPVVAYAAAVLLLSGLGGMFFISSQFGFDTYEFVGGSSGSEFFLRSIVLGTVLALVMVVAWSGVTMMVLRQLAGVDANLYGIARVLGVAITPLVLALLLIIDDIFFGLSWIALGGVASLALIGVLEAIDARPGPAWLATLLGFAAFVVVLAFLGHGLRDYAPGFFVGG